MRSVIGLPRIVVVGSSNTDMVVKTDRIPMPGETVIGGDFVMAGGGKGANQAVAAARLGAEVTFVARLGRDVFGDQAIEGFQHDGINTEYVTRDKDTPSGVALIFVDANGENVIVVAPGANDRLQPEHVQQARKAFDSADVLLVQLEVPLDTVTAAVSMAKETGTTVILNPAPARELPDSLLKMVDVLTPNETEAARLSGVDPTTMEPGEVGENLLALGVQTVVMTLGAQGGIIITRDGALHFEALKVDAVDTTAAGDAFSGALAVALAEGKDLKDAAGFAAKVAALSVTRMGAQPSLPTRQEVLDI